VHGVRWEELLDLAKADDLALARTRERWLRQQATTSATVLGTLLDLAERGAAVSVGLLGGRRHDGVVLAIGLDVVLLAERDDRVAIALGAVTTFRPAPGAGGRAATGDRPAAVDIGFVELLARVVDDQPDVAISLVTGESMTGRLLAVGADVVSMRVAAGDDGVAYCSTSAVSSVRLRSG
jgi:hypothetical protein